MARDSGLKRFRKEAIKAIWADTVRELVNHFLGKRVPIHPPVFAQIKPSTPSANSKCFLLMHGGVRPQFTDHSCARWNLGGTREFLLSPLV